MNPFPLQPLLLSGKRNIKSFLNYCNIFLNVSPALNLVGFFQSILNIIPRLIQLKRSDQEYEK